MKAFFKRVGLFFIQVWIMLNAETPRFFRNLTRMFLVILAVAEVAYPLLVQFVNQLTIYQIVAPDWLNELIKLVGAVSAGGALVSQLVVKWPALPKHEQEILNKKPQS